jgi:hypothetical protein
MIRSTSTFVQSAEEYPYRMIPFEKKSSEYLYFMFRPDMPCGVFSGV